MRVLAVIAFIFILIAIICSLPGCASLEKPRLENIPANLLTPKQLEFLRNKDPDAFAPALPRENQPLPTDRLTSNVGRTMVIFCPLIRIILNGPPGPFYCLKLA